LFSLPFIAISGLFLLYYRVTGWQITALMITQGLLTGMVPTATFAAAPEIMRKPQLAGLGLGVVLLGQYLGQLLGPVLFGQLVQAQGWATAGYAMIPFALLGLVSAWFVRAR
jgi:DHA1 family inner membrane transport protein